MYALFSTVDLTLQSYIYILIANVTFSWLYAFNIINPHNHFVHMIGTLLFQATEPVLRPIRRVLPNLGAIDIAPVVVFLVIYFIRTLIWHTICPIFL
ncbi:MAG: YggT family protein [Candidatus Tokpelaia sp. JSC085]|nr:MAG: YggT family protein [Candidatus Tokpelaia sp. JSC085]